MHTTHYVLRKTHLRTHGNAPRLINLRFTSSANCSCQVTDQKTETKKNEHKKQWDHEDARENETPSSKHILYIYREKC